MSDELKKIWAKVDARMGPQRMETEAEHIARDIREGNFPKRSDPIQIPVDPVPEMTHPPRLYISIDTTGPVRRYVVSERMHPGAKSYVVEFANRNEPFDLSQRVWNERLGWVGGKGE